MAEIGRGAQYVVTDNNDGRVRKVPLTPEESRRVVAGWYEPGAAPAEELEVDFLGATMAACAVVRRLVAQHPAVASSLGNPVFEEGGTYTQDKVQTLGARLEHVSDEEGTRLLARFADLVVEHWRWGFSDIVFNCVVNNGVAADGNVILIDFGELTDRKADVAARVSAQRWLSAWSYRRGLPSRFREPYRVLMADKLTLDVLNANWGTRLRTSIR